MSTQAAATETAEIPQREELLAQLENQRRSFLAELPVSAEQRIDRIDRALALLVDNEDALCEAMDQDYGGRPKPLSRFADIMSAVNHLKHARANLKRWMRRERRPLRFPLGLLGARAWIEYQPLGSIGIISPWNFPILLSFGPMAGALAAGNRCMIKPSEFTPATSELLRDMIAGAFDPEEIHVVTGGPETGKAFASLPFDHLLFTGATAIGPHILHAAADNLTPVTLELGGKSPTIVGSGAKLDETARKIVLGKMMNAGQACLAPDYLFVPEAQLEAFIGKLGDAYRDMYPDAASSTDATAIVNERHNRRLASALEEARNQGVRVEQFGDYREEQRGMPLTVLVNPPEELQVMREEIFGPLLPLLPYREIDSVIDEINRRDRPLGLYYFGTDAAERRRVLDRTIAGGVTLNDVLFHISVDDLPFGGVGPSGMGAYHGIEGFRRFSHAKAVYRQSPLNLSALMGVIPPYGKRLQATLKREIRR